MPKIKKNAFADEKPERPKPNLLEQIKKASEGLWYISETDAKIFPFTGSKTSHVTRENLLTQIGKPLDTAVEERDFNEMFARFVRVEDWHGDQEKVIAARFAALKNLLQNNLTDLRVYKVGQIELDIYFVGLDTEGNLTGIQTKAVET